MIISTPIVEANNYVAITILCLHCIHIYSMTKIIIPPKTVVTLTTAKLPYV